MDNPQGGLKTKSRSKSFLTFLFNIITRDEGVNALSELIIHTWFVSSLYKRLKVNAYGAMLKSMNIRVGKWIHGCFIQFGCLKEKWKY